MKRYLLTVLMVLVVASLGAPRVGSAQTFKVEKFDIKGPQGGVPSMGNAERKSHAEHPRGTGPSVKRSDSVRSGDPKMHTAGQRYTYAMGGMARNPRANKAVHAKTHKPTGAGGLKGMGAARGLGALAQAAGASMPPMGGGGGPGGMPGGPGMAPPPGLGAPMGGPMGGPPAM